MILKTLLPLFCVLCSIIPASSWLSGQSRAKIPSIGCSKTVPLYSSPDRDFNGDAVGPPDLEGSEEFENEENAPSDEEIEATLGNWDDRVAQLNTVHLVGRIGNNPEPRYFDDGKVVVNLSLAVKRKYHYLEREYLGIKYGDEETDWFGLEIWGTTAEFVSKFVDKGARVGVIGSLNIDEWTDKETGEPRSRPKVTAREFEILETKAEAELRRSGQRGQSSYSNDDRRGPSSYNNDDRRGPSFYSNDDEYQPSKGSKGGFFD